MTQKRLMRNSYDSKLGGVCGGLARYLNVDATLVRVLVVVAVVFTFPVGLLAYVVMWAVMPQDSAQYPPQYGATYQPPTAPTAPSQAPGAAPEDPKQG